MIWNIGFIWHCRGILTCSNETSNSHMLKHYVCNLFACELVRHFVQLIHLDFFAVLYCGNSLWAKNQELNARNARNLQHHCRTDSIYPSCFGNTASKDLGRNLSWEIHISDLLNMQRREEMIIFSVQLMLTHVFPKGMDFSWILSLPVVVWLHALHYVH